MAVYDHRIAAASLPPLEPAVLRGARASASALSARPPASAAEAEGEDLERTRLAGEGDSKAQAWLLARVIGPVRRIARAFLRSSADADDAAQLALLAILRSASTYRGEAPVEVWARRVAVRTILRFIQRERRQDPRMGAQEEGIEEPSVEDGEPTFEALPRDIREYLMQLPEAQRNAVILHHALGYSIDEIGELTEVSPDTVKSRIRLGTAALRRQVQREIAFGRGRSS